MLKYEPYASSCEGKNREEFAGRREYFRGKWQQLYCRQSEQNVFW
jgi:hypothetical protein